LITPPDFPVRLFLALANAAFPSSDIVARIASFDRLQDLERSQRREASSAGFPAVVDPAARTGCTAAIFTERILIGTSSTVASCSLSQTAKRSQPDASNGCIDFKMTGGISPSCIV
jgi:hypothetical protein